MTFSRTENLKAAAYGHSFLAWPDRWSYLHRLERRYGWTLANRAVGGERSTDVAARAIAGAPAGKYTQGEADLIVVDCAINDMMGGGLGGLLGYRNALTALLSWLSLEGVIEDGRTDQIGYSGTWTSTTGAEWSGGSQRSVAGDGVAKLPGYGRAGKWAFGYYGLSDGCGTGDSFTLAAAGTALATFSTHAQGLPSLSPAAGGGPRNWTAAAQVVCTPEPVSSFTLKRTVPGSSGGGPYFDWYGKINEATPPLIICPTPVRYTAAGYALSGVNSDAVVAAYTQALRDVAALVGPHVQVVNVDPGWCPDTMLLPDRMHPNPRGSAHIADRIADTLDVLDW